MSRHVHVSYSDDLRQELNGKFSLMGLYNDTMLLSSFPVTLPKLAIVVNARTPYNYPFTGFSIAVTYNGMTLSELIVSQEEYEANRRKGSNPFDDHHIQAHFVLSPLQLEEPGVIEVRFQSGAYEVKCNSLTIRNALPGELQ